MAIFRGLFVFWFFRFFVFLVLPFLDTTDEMPLASTQLATGFSMVQTPMAAGSISPWAADLIGGRVASEEQINTMW